MTFSNSFPADWSRLRGLRAVTEPAQNRFQAEFDDGCPHLDRASASRHGHPEIGPSGPM